MNKEYRKFNELAEVYIPPATDPGYFSNMPDVLIPQDYHEAQSDPLEQDVADLIRETKTPPPTPPEDEPGKAGCRMFRDKKHYVDPIYENPAYRRMFTTKLIIANMLSYAPIVILMIALISYDALDYVLVEQPKTFVIVLILTLVARAVSVYFVGLFRNPPLLHIALGIRILLNTIIFCCLMAIIHAFFLYIIGHAGSSSAEFNNTRFHDDDHGDSDIQVVEVTHDEGHDHAPPYMAILIIIMMWIVEGIICVLIFRRKYPIDDYRIPFTIYTSCFSTSALLVTIVLNNGFGFTPLGYDLFQVICGCYITSLILMRTPQFIIRLYEGKVCPLKEDELLYALIHWGL